MIQQSDTSTKELFQELPSARPNLDELQAQAIRAILTLFKERRPVVIGTSFGKDSTATTHLAFVAAAEAARSGLSPMIVVSNADTLSENPEISRLGRREANRMARYAKRYGIKFISQVATPSLLSTTQVRILSGRAIPSYPGSRMDCTQDLKIRPMRSERNRLFKELASAGLKDPVTLLGTRLDESIGRGSRMRARGDRADAPVQNAAGDWIMCPIANWSSDDVFELLGLVSAGAIESYSDFKDVLRIYAHSGGTSCAVVSHDILEGKNKRQRGGCGARTGCALCCAVSSDSSLATMADYDESYAYARPLVRFADILRNCRYDWTLRSWVGRTLRDGYVAIQPDTFSASFIRSLTRMLLQIDHDEVLRARQANEAPRFQMLTLEMRIVLDMLQNLNGLRPPFSLWADLRDIEQRGIRYDVVSVPKTPPQPQVEARFLHVGTDWMVQDGTLGGLRDAYIEAMTEDSPCLPNMKELGPGHFVWNLETEKGLSVDPEVACFIASEFQDDLLERHDHWLKHPSGLTGGFKWYAQLGTPTFDHSHLAMYDEVARRTEWKWRKGLALEYDHEALYASAVPYRELPEHARATWATKASDAGAQVDIDDMFRDAMSEA